MTEQDKAFHKSFKPSWARDGTLIYASATGNINGGNNSLVNVNTPVISEGRDVQFAKFTASSVSARLASSVAHTTDISDCLTYNEITART